MSETVKTENKVCGTQIPRYTNASVAENLKMTKLVKSHRLHAYQRPIPLSEL